MGFFFQQYWDIVGEDVVRVVTQFFKQGWILHNLNSNIVILIPKVPGSGMIENFGPIALANFKFKIIMKGLCDSSY